MKTDEQRTGVRGGRGGGVVAVVRGRAGAVDGRGMKSERMAVTGRHIGQKTTGET